MTAIIADARTLTGAEFYQMATGKRLPTKAEREAKYRADVERYADFIEQGSEWAVPPPCLWDARKIVAERAERADLEPKRRPDGRYQVAA